MAKTSIPAVLALVLAACGGGAAGSEDGVASIDGSDSSNGSEPEASAASSEEALVDYVACLREQGLDVADPTVDAEGNLQFGPGELSGDAGHEPSQADHARFQEDFAAAQEVCGEPPEDVVGGFGHGDEAEHDDDQLAYAQCMRDEGFDVPDPGTEAEVELDEDDPAFQAAHEQCQQEVFGADGRGGDGG